MEGNRRLLCAVLAATAYAGICGCDVEETNGADRAACVEVVLQCTGHATRSGTEGMISDINLVIFENGIAESIVWRELAVGTDVTNVSLKLKHGHVYSIYAAANIGEKIMVERHEDLEQEYMKLETPYDAHKNPPMTTSVREMTAEDGMTLKLSLTRLTSQISLKMDRSRLDAGISLDVLKVGIGNCPMYAVLYGTNSVGSTHDCFQQGFHLSDEECSPLNLSGRAGLSGEVHLYMLENMQGNFPTAIADAEEKFFADEDPMSRKCSYIEMEIGYRSDDMISYDSNLIYRFYLGETLNSLDVERNCHYHITVTPEGNGLSGSGWRVDKSGIGPSTPVFSMYPGDYIEGHIGDRIHIWCEYYPSSASLDIGYEELDFDKSRGIYDYAVDEDGKGVTLTLKKEGTGIVYMSAGEPVNQSGMAMIVVYP